jgi:HEPN domain-containing protein
LVNVLDWVEGMTAPFAASLTPAERETLLRGYAVSQLHLSRIGDLTAQPFVPEARADLRESVEHMFRNEAQFGLSKWASLQAVEKFLKAYIQQQGTTPEPIHILKQLAGTAESLGLRPIPRKVLALAQCSPAARYKGSSVSRQKAVESYRTAVEITGEIALQLVGKSAWSTEIYHDEVLTITGGEKIPVVVMRRFKVRSGV